MLYNFFLLFLSFSFIFSMDRNQIDETAIKRLSSSESQNTSSNTLSQEKETSGSNKSKNSKTYENEENIIAIEDLASERDISKSNLLNQLNINNINLLVNKKARAARYAFLFQLYQKKITEHEIIAIYDQISDDLYNGRFINKIKDYINVELINNYNYLPNFKNRIIDQIIKLPLDKDEERLIGHILEKVKLNLEIEQTTYEKQKRIIYYCGLGLIFFFALGMVIDMWVYYKQVNINL